MFVGTGHARLGESDVAPGGTTPDLPSKLGQPPLRVSQASTSSTTCMCVASTNG